MRTQACHSGQGAGQAETGKVTDAQLGKGAGWMQGVSPGMESRRHRLPVVVPAAAAAAAEPLPAGDA